LRPVKSLVRFSIIVSDFQEIGVITHRFGQKPGFRERRVAEKPGFYRNTSLKPTDSGKNPVSGIIARR
jgi:hypothetical protein